MKKLLFILGCCCTCFVQAQVSNTINLSTAGTLGTILNTTQKDTITHLKLTGTIDDRDFYIISDSMPNLTSIDLSGATIAAYNGNLGTSSDTSYAASVIPTNAFFYASNITSVVLPPSITSIGTSAFEQCSGLTSISIPASVTSIGEFAFQGCSSLKSISIPSSVTSIGAETFQYCSSLNSITNNSIAPQNIADISSFQKSDVFMGVDTMLCTLYVPKGSYSTYKLAIGWKAFNRIVEMGIADSSTITASACGSYTLNDSIYTASGTYTQTLKNVSGGDSVITLKLTVYPLPTITVTATPDTISTITSGDSSILTARGGSSYNWSNGDTTASQTVSPIVSTMYTVTGTDGNGCSDEVDTWVWVNGISHADSIKAIDKSWRAAFRATVNPKVVLFNFTDSLICPEKNTAGTAVVYQHPAGTQHNCGLNYIDYEPQGATASTLSTYFDSTNNCLRVNYDQSSNIDSVGKGTDNWNDVMKTYWVQKVQPATQTDVSFNPFKDTTITPTAANPDQRAVPCDSLVGVMLDLTDTTKRIVTITYAIIGLPQTDSADIRFDLFDVNGRSTCGHSTKRVIGRPSLGDNDGNFHQISFYWSNPEGGDWTQGPGMVFDSGDGALNDEDQKDFSDGYQATWFNLMNGRGYNSAVNTVGPVGEQGLFDFSNAAVFYPASEGGNSALTGDPWDIPIDAAHIIGFGFMINDGPSCLYHTAKFSLLIRSIIIGDDSQLGTCGEYIFGQGNEKGAVAGQQCKAIDVGQIIVSDSSSATIDTIGGSIQMYAKVLPANLLNKNVAWSVSPTGLATIDSLGVLTALGTANGNVIVTATALDGGGTSGDEVIAITNQVRLQIAYQDKTNKTPMVGDMIQFSASNAYYSVLWTVSDTSIASIDTTSGLLIPKAVGTVTVTATMVDGSLLQGSETIIIGTTLPADSSTITASACGSYTLNDSTYTASGIYTQIVKNIAGGDSVITLNLTVYTYPVPMISVTATTDSIAIGANVVLTASGGSSFTWSDGGTTASETVSPKTSTTYSVTVVDAYDCIDSTSKTIAVAPLVFESVTITNGGTMLLITLNTDIQLYNGIDSDFTVMINDTLKAYVTDAVTQVMKDGSNPNVLLLQLATPLPAGTSVTISYAPVNPETGLATALSNFTLKTTETAVALTKQLGVKLYPNPAQTNITVQANQLQTVRVYTMQGQCVASVLASNETAVLSVASLPAGMYVAELITANETVRKAFVKE